MTSKFINSSALRYEFKDSLNSPSLSPQQLSDRGFTGFFICPVKELYVKAHLSLFPLSAKDLWEQHLSSSLPGFQGFPFSTAFSPFDQPKQMSLTSKTGVKSFYIVYSLTKTSLRTLPHLLHAIYLQRCVTWCAQPAARTTRSRRPFCGGLEQDLWGGWVLHLTSTSLASSTRPKGALAR